MRARTVFKDADDLDVAFGVPRDEGFKKRRETPRHHRRPRLNAVFNGGRYIYRRPRGRYPRDTLQINAADIVQTFDHSKALSLISRGKLG